MNLKVIEQETEKFFDEIKAHLARIKREKGLSDSQDIAISGEHAIMNMAVSSFTRGFASAAQFVCEVFLEKDLSEEAKTHILRLLADEANRLFSEKIAHLEPEQDNDTLPMMDLPTDEGE